MVKSKSARALEFFGREHGRIRRSCLARPKEQHWLDVHVIGGQYLGSGEHFFKVYRSQE
jgi:hypothetical protein